MGVNRVQDEAQSFSAEVLRVVGAPPASDAGASDAPLLYQMMC